MTRKTVASVQTLVPYARRMILRQTTISIMNGDYTPGYGMEINAARRLREMLRRLAHCRSLAKTDSNELSHANATAAL